MTDVYDIKELILGIPFNIIYSLIFIMIVSGLYLIFLYSFKKNKENIIYKKGNTPLLNKEKKIDYIKLLEQLEKNGILMDQNIFYSKLSLIIRLYLEDKLLKKITIMTFQELKTLHLDPQIENLMKKIYFKEFSQQTEDSEDIRASILAKTKELLLKKNNDEFSL